MAMVYEDLDIKTIVADSPAEIDKQCNEFKKNHTVRFTQANQVWCGDALQFINTIFFIPVKSAAKSMGIPTTAPPSGVTIQEQWATCSVEGCARRWKWSHFKMCPNSHTYEQGLGKEFHEQFKKIHNIS